MGKLKVTNSSGEEIKAGVYSFGPGASQEVTSEHADVFKKAGLDVQFVNDDGSLSDKAPKKSKSHKKHDDHDADDHEDGDGKSIMSRIKSFVKGSDADDAKTTAASTQVNPLAAQKDVSAENPSHQTVNQHDGSADALPVAPVLEPGVKTNPEGTKIISDVRDGEDKTVNAPEQTEEAPKGKSRKK